MMNKTRSPRWYGIKNCMILITLAIVVAFGATFETKIIAQELEKHPLLVINGKKTDKTVQSLNAENVQRINVIKDTTVAVAKYGRDAAHGVIEVVMIDSLESAKPVTMADVKVEAYGTHKDASMSNSSDEVTVLGYGQIKDSKNPLVIVDGKKINFNEINNYKPNSITVLKGEEAVNLYGDEGKNGVLIISTKGKTSKEEFIIRNSNTLKEPLYVVNGQIVSKEEGNKIKPEDISSLNVLKDDQAVNKYGTSGKDGVVEITLKNQVHVETNNSLIIVPNPSSDNVEVTLKGVQPTGKLDVKVYDKHGKLIYQDKKTGPTFDLSVTGMETGSYFVIVSEKNNIYKGKLIVGQ